MLRLVLVLVFAVTPIEKIFQSFHLYKTTHRTVLAAGYTVCCVRNKLRAAVHVSRRVSRDAGCPRDAAFTRLFPICQLLVTRQVRAPGNKFVVAR